MIIMSSSDVISWSSDYCLNWSDFQAESNPAIYEDSHSFIKYGFTWIVDSDKLNENVVFLINDIKFLLNFILYYLGLENLNLMMIYCIMNKVILIWLKCLRENMIKY